MRSNRYLLPALFVAALFSACKDSPTEVVEPNLGVVWTKQISGTTEALNSVAYGNQWVAVGSAGIILTSPDGITWTKRVSGTDLPINSLLWTGQQWVAVSSAGDILTSPDGITWTLRESLGVNVNYMARLGKKFFAVGYEGLLLSSGDGMAWKQDSLPGKPVLYSMAGSNQQQLVTVGYDGAVWTSP